MSKLAETIKRKPSVAWLLLLVVAAVVFVLGLVAARVTERRAEIASIYNNRKVEIASTAPTFVPSNTPSKEHDKKKVDIAKSSPGIEGRNDAWGVNFPHEFNTWKKTRETDFQSKYLGNNVEDVLSERPNMVILWAGYAFSRDYSAPRGHWYALHDMRKSLRTGAPGVGENKDMQPGTCWTCKGPDVPRMMQTMGVGEFYKSKWSALGHEIVNPIGCADCHDPKTMSLTITRPGLVEAFKRRDIDVKEASPQQMRSLVCAQCHVEYYFAEGGMPDGNKYLTFPWDKGYTVEDMEKYYDQPIFGEGENANKPYKDWVHALSKAPMLKAQHPDWEIYMMGTHGKRGVSCADCHMPYKSEGGIKYTNHQIMSPLKNVAGTCQTCHRDSEERLKSYVYDHQDKILQIRNRVETELAKAHIMTKIALDNGVKVEDLKSVHALLRAAGWRWDFGVASHGASFHAPVETARILSAALDKSLLAQIELQKILTEKNITVTMPDISDKDKAQAYVGLEMDKLRAAKKEFMAKVVPGWIEKAKANGKLTEPDLLDQYTNYQYPEPAPPHRPAVELEPVPKW